ncbi:DUF2339 domain-containing protein [Clostridium sp. E02]|uniref:DUF2339 domain-containing protein n=1 Tax=Clostridium sp. E02 TaxID=2487134 RepID=UPI000F5255EB|nr:DUF2339 domain-containing protein [Clostridium sp. E02]
MKTAEERITELEQRITLLESIINKQQADTNRTPLNAKPNHVTMVRPESPVQTLPPGITKQSLIAAKNPAGSDKETLVGKYIIGGMASLLIFIGAISFIGLVWNRMTPGFKLSILTAIGLILTGVGFKTIRIRKNAISSIILGTGAGLLFISILSANLAFHIIGSQLSLLLAGLWAVFFILTSRYTKQFFTVMIAYIGSYIALVLGLTLMQGNLDLLVMILFALCISAVMLWYTAKGPRIRFLISIILAAVSNVTILFGCYLDGLLSYPPLLTGYVYQTLVLVLIYLLLNLLYQKLNDGDTVPVYLLAGIGVSILTLIHLLYLIGAYLTQTLTPLTCYLLFFSVHLVQFFLTARYTKTADPWLGGYYGGILAITMLFLNAEWIGVPVGMVLIGLLLVVNEKVLKRSAHPFLISGILLFDTLFLAFGSPDILICIMIGALQIGLMFYVLWDNLQKKQYAQTNLLKSLGLIVLIINSFTIPRCVSQFLWIHFSIGSSTSPYGFVLAVLVLCGLVRWGYFKNWKDPKFVFWSWNKELYKDTCMQVIFYLISTILYIVGVVGVTMEIQAGYKLLFTGLTLVIAGIQSREILKEEGHKLLLGGIWICIKYILFSWVVLYSFSNLTFASPVYSILGLLIAIGIITAGFRWKAKGIRPCGLALAILMVVKFIIIDLHQENSITRVAGLIAGGGLCFLISLIYNKLSQNEF